MKRAVGRGPDAEGPLGFFKMECFGGGFDDDDDVRSLVGRDGSLSSSMPSTWSGGSCGPFPRCAGGSSRRPKGGA